MQKSGLGPRCSQRSESSCCTVGSAEITYLCAEESRMQGCETSCCRLCCCFFSCSFRSFCSSLFLWSEALPARRHPHSLRPVAPSAIRNLPEYWIRKYSPPTTTTDPVPTLCSLGFTHHSVFHPSIQGLPGPGCFFPSICPPHSW